MVTISIISDNENAPRGSNKEHPEKLALANDWSMRRPIEKFEANSNECLVKYKKKKKETTIIMIIDVETQRRVNVNIPISTNYQSFKPFKPNFR